MNWIDLLLVLIVLLAVWIGWKKGFIRGSLGLLAWTGSILLGFLFYRSVAKGIAVGIDLGVWLLPVAFLSTIILSRILSGIIIRRIYLLIPEKANDNLVNRFFGIAPGVINGAVAATVIAAILLAIPVRDSGITKEARQSRIAMVLANKVGWANEKLAPVFDEAARQTMSSLAETTKSHESETLHFTYDDAIVRPVLEAKMLALINEERAKEGLKPLKADRELAVVARSHSRDMFVKGYFAHENLEGKSPFDRMKDAKIKFRKAGENLALAQTLELAHRNLMNSPGHRANIMSPGFGRVGIGVLDGGFYGLMISQEFRD